MCIRLRWHCKSSPALGPNPRCSGPSATAVAALFQQHKLGLRPQLQPRVFDNGQVIITLSWPAGCNGLSVIEARGLRGFKNKWQFRWVSTTHFSCTLSFGLRSTSTSKNPSEGRFSTRRKPKITLSSIMENIIHEAAKTQRGCYAVLREPQPDSQHSAQPAHGTAG